MDMFHYRRARSLAKSRVRIVLKQVSSWIKLVEAQKTGVGDIEGNNISMLSLCDSCTKNSDGLSCRLVFCFASIF